MDLVFTLFFLAFLISVVFHYGMQLAREDEERAPIKRWLLAWLGKGVGGSFVLWIAFNSGLLGLPSLMTDIEVARAAGKNLFEPFMRVTLSALFIIVSYWAALSFVWMLVLIWRRIQDRSEFFGLCIAVSVFLAPIAAGLFYVTGWMGAGFAMLVWLGPIAHFTLPLAVFQKPLPAYSTAIAKMKFGKFEEAEWEVIRQLEKCEDDFEGWMMLADLYANQFHDLAIADQTIRDLCQQPGTTTGQVAIALHRLADWHLKWGEDPAPARRALEDICQRAPGTHLDKMARQRLSRLPATGEELRQQRQGRTIHLPALSDDLDPDTDSGAPEANREKSVAQANQCVAELKHDPDNVPAREKLARLFAEQLDQVEPGIAQLELLLEMPDQPPERAAEWLSLIAAWHLRFRRDPAAAHGLLQRLIREYPQTPQAFAAQRRLHLMDMEQKIRKVRTNAPGSSKTADAISERP